VRFFSNPLLHSQRVVLFQPPSLKVYAADWRYQLVFRIVKTFDKKEEIKHICEISERERVDRWNTEDNMLDAVALLRRLIDLKSHTLKISEIEEWFTLDRHSRRELLIQSTKIFPDP
jgi:hypothetical protein